MLFNYNHYDICVVISTSDFTKLYEIGNTINVLGIYRYMTITLYWNKNKWLFLWEEIPSLFDKNS